MASLTVSLTEHQESFVQRQVSAGRCGSASEYVAELIANDEQHQLELEELLREGKRGTARELKPEDWVQLRAEAFQAYQSQRSDGI